MYDILFLDQYGERGGGQQVLLELVSAAHACGRRVCVMLPDGPSAARLEALGACVVRVQPCDLHQGRKNGRDVLRFAVYNCGLLLRHIREFREAKLVYVNGNRLLLAAALSSILLGARVAYHIHLNHGRTERALFTAVLRLRGTRALVMPSDFIRRALTAADPRFDNPRCVMVENGLDARFADIPYVDRFSGHPLRHVGILGRVSPEKGQDVLLPLAREFPQLDFHVLGDAAFSAAGYLAHLRAEAPGNVYFHGWVEDVPAKVTQLGLQVCLVPSRCPADDPSRSFEAAPLVPLQMAALSCLVAVRDLGALHNVAQTLQLSTFDTDASISKVLRTFLAAMPETLAATSRATFSMVAQRYSHEAFQQRLQTLLSTLLEVSGVKTFYPSRHSRDRL